MLRPVRAACPLCPHSRHSTGSNARASPDFSHRILLRANSGFARDDLMTWCEESSVDFLFGLTKNARLIAAITPELERAAAKSPRTGKPERRFKSFMWRTRKTWSRRRHVVAKAECTHGEANPRFVVTSLTRAQSSRSIFTRRSTAPAAIWRTRSRSASSISMPTEPRRPRCAPISCASGSTRWRMCCCAPRAGSACATPPSPTPPAAPSVSSS